ncbi:MAG: hypothetical protein F6K16_39620 [Symploca sp. SIO2B6]|nr:hypothetical protein [Symploca sp. SIO2B6]
MNNKNSKPRILIICTHFHSDRSNKTEKVFLQTMAGLHVASMLDGDQYDVTLYHESYHGPYNTQKLDDVDIVFLTGLQKDFDRMRQLSFFFRRQGTLVVAGGNICTLFPDFASEFFDVVSVGGVECTLQIMKDFEVGALKKIYYSPQIQASDYIAKYELLSKSGIYTPIHFIEASRGCNFKCDFCVIPAEGAKHTTYRVGTVAKTIQRAIQSSPFLSIQRLFPLIFFIDNNFSNNLPYIKELCTYLKNCYSIRGWGALITQNTLQNRELITMMAESRCRILFTGIESFDEAFLSQHNKVQNTLGKNSIFDDIQFAQQKGIVIIYPYMFDPRISSVKDMEGELEMLVNLENLTFPDFFTTVSPLVGTKLFWESAQKGELLPNLRLRDLDGQCLAYRHTVDSFDAYSKFFQKLYSDTLKLLNRPQFFWNLFKKIVKIGVRHPISIPLFYRSSINHIQDASKNSRTITRNYIGGQDILDPQYTQYPGDITLAEKIRYFQPIEITDSTGNLQPWLQQYQPTPTTLLKTESQQNELGKITVQ